MTIADLGNFSLAMAVLAALLALLASLAAAQLESPRCLVAARWLIGSVAVLLTLCMASLAAALINCDFRIAYVTHYVERALPLGYKLAALWAGQEGSILLWGWLLAVLATIFAASRRDLAPAEGAAVYSTVSIVCCFFAVILLFAANPFVPSDKVPADGHGLNPLLQNPAMIAHPPVLFLGYAGFTFPFALLVGALVSGRRDNHWLAGARRWLIVSWLFLTVGILLGAQWAYVELGWGGYWAWDPVENASLLPWLIATALLHSVAVQQHRGMFKRWNASLIALAFVLCIFGTYLTRSGVIQSVHAFGESLIGTFFLAFLVVTALASAALIAVRWNDLAPEHPLQGLTGREGAFLATNMLLLGIMLVTLVGTILPLLSRLVVRREMSVGGTFYNSVVGPMGMLLVALMAIGPMLNYGDVAGRRLLRRAAVPAALAIVAAFIAYARGVSSAWALACTAIVALGVACVAADLFAAIAGRVRDGDNIAAAVVRTIDGNHRRYGGQLTHLGMLMLLAGVVGASVFQQKQDLQLRPGEVASIAGQTLKFVALKEVRQANYTAVQAELTLTAADGTVSTLTPQRRFYDQSEQPNSEVAIRTTWKSDVYLTLAGWEQTGQLTAIQVIVNPLVSWIWVGGIVMAAGAIFCLVPRFAPRAKVTTTAAAVPAEKGSRGRAGSGVAVGTSA